MGSASGKGVPSRRKTKHFCRVCHASDTQIRRAVEQCIDIPDDGSINFLHRAIGGYIIAFKKIRNHLNKGQ